MLNPVVAVRDACTHTLADLRVYDNATKQSRVLPIKPDAKLRVIGAGHRRTATLSLYVALMTLGMRTYHGMELAQGHNPRDVARKWLHVQETDLAQGNTNGIDFHHVMKGFEAGCDNPFAEYWLELSRAFPDAKIIYTHRDKLTWNSSYIDTIVNPMIHDKWYAIAIAWFPALRTARKSVGLLLKKYDRDCGGLRPELMDEKLAEIRKEVSPDRLLVFHPREGWEPLCRFLQVPVPDVPFPKLNDGPSMQFALTTVTIVGCGMWLAVFAVLLSALRDFVNEKRGRDSVV